MQPNPSGSQNREPEKGQRQKDMTQSKLESLIESIVNILIGYTVAIASQLVIFPMFGVNLPLSDNLMIGAWFTLISLARSYIIRRHFNQRLKRAIHAATEHTHIGAPS